jgi:hypothetical protein
MVDRLAFMVVDRRFLRIGVVDSRSLHYGTYAHMKEFIRSSSFLRLLGDMRREFMQPLYMAHWVVIFKMLCIRAVVAIFIVVK